MYASGFELGRREDRMIFGNYPRTPVELHESGRRNLGRDSLGATLLPYTRQLKSRASPLALKWPKCSG